MILYSTGDTCLGIEVLKLRGSVLPKAIGWGLGFSSFAALLHLLPLFGVADADEDGKMDFLENVDASKIGTVWAAYSSILGFLVVFRNNQAYARFWEGASLVRQIRGEWFNATSALIAFSSHEVETQAEKMAQNRFKHMIVRLFSALYCSALQHVCDLDESSLQVLDLNVLTPNSIAQLEAADDRCQLIILWLQRLIVRAFKKEILQVPSPILTRVFQELSRGVVHLTNLRKLKEVPFPFPYQQTLLFMLYAHNTMTAVLSVALLNSLAWSIILTFLVVLSFWSVIFIAVEIDQPFGDDPNDLPLVDMQNEFNNSLGALLQSSGQELPGLIDEGDVIKKLRSSIKYHSVKDLEALVIPLDSDVSSDGQSETGGNDDGDFKDAQGDSKVTFQDGESVDSRQKLVDSGRIRPAGVSEDQPLPPQAEGLERATSAPPSPTERARFQLNRRLSTSSEHLGGRTSLQEKKDRPSTKATQATTDLTLADVFKKARQEVEEQGVARRSLRNSRSSEGSEQQAGRAVICV